MKRIIVTCISILTFFTSCGKKDSVPEYANNRTEENTQLDEEQAPTDPMMNKGIGPVKSLELSEAVDDAMAKKGEELYNSKCTSCHRPTEKFIGPAPKDILERRTPEWVMNMILNPEEMIQKDPIAKQLLAEANGAPMANQNLTEEEARQVLEYFRTIK